MSTKRSERLRSLITSTLNDAAADAAPVTITGSGRPNIASEESRVKNSWEEKEIKTQEIILSVEALTQDTPHQEESIVEEDPAHLPSQVALDAPEDPPQAASPKQPVFYVPQRVMKSPTYQKANMTLYPRDLETLELYDKTARSYGFRLRKGGNPSLFIRTGLRLLERLLHDDPQEWINQVSATMLATEDKE